MAPLPSPPFTPAGPSTQFTAQSIQNTLPPTTVVIFPTLLTLPLELREQIYVALLYGIHLIITVTDSTLTYPNNTAATTTTASITSVRCNPPLTPLRLTCRAFATEIPPVARRCRCVTSILWDCTDATHRTIPRQIPLLGNDVPAGRVLRGVREVEVCLPRGVVSVAGTMDRWVGRVLEEARAVERVLLNVGVRRVRVGEWAVCVEGARRGEVLQRGVLERWACFEASEALVKQMPGVSVLVEFALLCPVRMECCGRVGECGEACFRENFMVPSTGCRHSMWLMSC